MAVGRLVRDGAKRPSQPVLAACGPRPKGDTQQVTKKPASPWRPVSRRGKLDQRQEEDVAGLDRFARLLLAGQPCQPQLVMDPHQRVRLRRLLVIGHHQLCAPRPLRRMPPLQKPSVSTPIRRSPPLTHRSGSSPILGGSGSSDTFYERAALRAKLDPGQRFQSPPRVRARTGLQKLQVVPQVGRRMSGCAPRVSRPVDPAKWLLAQFVPGSAAHCHK